jgi:sensor histidine kinase YesM
MSLAAALRHHGEAARQAWPRVFTGLSGPGLAVLAVLCVVNAIRRVVRSIPEPGVHDDLSLPIRFVELIALSSVVALPIALAVVATYNLSPRRPAVRYPLLAVAVLLSSLASVALAAVLENWWFGGVMIDPGPPLQVAYRFLQNFWFRYFALAGLCTAVYVYARRSEEKAAAARQAELDRQSLDQQMEEARLQMLQAQIEPHFLFNSLASVRSLYHDSPQIGVAVLDNLMRYLSVLLPEMRAATTTLAREAALAESYLAIQKLRMGRRLDFAIDVPPGLGHLPIPPMMLLTLVENAIKHGISPLPEGGHVRVAASAAAGELRVQVFDSGRGFLKSSGGGTGLANMRARLAALFGRAGGLDLARNQPDGIVATLRLPLPPGTRANPG